MVNSPTAVKPYSQADQRQVGVVITELLHHAVSPPCSPPPGWPTSVVRRTTKERLKEAADKAGGNDGLRSEAKTETKGRPQAVL